MEQTFPSPTGPMKALLSPGRVAGQGPWSGRAGSPPRRSGGRKGGLYLGGAFAAVCWLGLGNAGAQELTGDADTDDNIYLTRSASEVVANALRTSSLRAAEGNLDQALHEIDVALQLDPRNTTAYELRASIYIQQRLWDRAEEDYRTALKIDPTSTRFKFKLADLKFMQQDYDNARPGFAALENDPALGDLAKFKVFLCDLLGRHDDAAAQDLAAIDRGGATPAYYFGHAAWCLYHRKMGELSHWLTAAAQVDDPSKNTPYIESLKSAQVVHPPTVAFMAKDGTSYGPAQAFVEPDGLRIMAQSGWVTIPFDQLPDDLSTFPQELRDQLKQTRLYLHETSTRPDVLSFTTKQGTSYDGVAWSLKDNGLAVSTKDGWVTIPFDQLTDDLSTFPTELAEDIATKQRLLQATNPDMEPVTFTTQAGTHYEQVRWAVDDLGVSVVTPSGWVLIPFDQLPDDLSGFPAELRDEIAAKRPMFTKSALGVKELTFTTKRGKHYEEVKWSVDKTGLFVLTSNGWDVIPFDELPDLSIFPMEVQKQIEMAKTNAAGPKSSSP